MANDRAERIAASLDRLSRRQLLIGIPADKTGRDPGPITNASLGYIHEKGSPARNIPARPHLVPGVQEVMPLIQDQMLKASKAAVRGDDMAVDQYLTNAGQAAADSVRKKIEAKLKPPIQPESYLRRTVGRARREEQIRRAIGASRAEMAPGTAARAEALRLGRYFQGVSFIAMARAEAPEATPLWDTGQYKNSITFVIRDRE